MRSIPRIILVLLMTVACSLFAQSIVDPQVSLTRDFAGNWSARWQGIADRTFYLQTSPNLRDWTYEPFMEFGTGAKTADLPPGDGKRHFFRLFYPEHPGITNLAQAKAADPDNDNLLSWDELTLFMTDPERSDTNGNNIPDGLEDYDGDTFANALELNGGWDAQNANDHPYDRRQAYGPLVIDADDVFCFPIGVLDSQGLDAEPGIPVRLFSDFAQWKIEITPIVGSGKPHKFEMSAVAQAVAENVHLVDTSIYKVKLDWIKSGDQYPQNWYCWEALIDGQPDLKTHIDIFNGQAGTFGDRNDSAKSFSTGDWIVVNVDGLLTKEVHLNATKGQNVVADNNYLAYLIPTRLPTASRYHGGDAVGPRYRKVTLSGRPLPDEKPEQESESDSYNEETYIDAYNLSLRHDTSIVYVPVPASDLVLQVNMSLRESYWSDRSGLRPSEELTLPFGACWTSNLCAYLEVEESIGELATDPIGVNVIDEGGVPQRFATLDMAYFTPWPSGRVDKKTSLNTLSKNGGTFTMVKKFGSTLTYEACNAWFMYMNDRVDGSKSSRKHTYYRLVKVQDRYGKSLTYNYGNSRLSLIPQSITSSAGESVNIVRSADCKRVLSVTAPNGQVTQFSYASSNTGGANSFSFEQLDKIHYPDATSHSYDYFLAEEAELVSGKTTRHFHCNLGNMVDRRSNEYSFTYVPDTSKLNDTSSENPTGPRFFAAKIESLPVTAQSIAKDELAKMNRNTPVPENQQTISRVFGLPQRISLVQLPDGTSSQFSSSSQTIFSPEPSARASTTVIDTLGNRTQYQYGNVNIEVVDIDPLPDSVSTEFKIYYDSLEITHSHGGTERFEFGGPSFSLTSHRDFSGNTTRWDYGSGPDALWSDPVAKTDALGRRESYTYEPRFRTMSSINDIHGTLTSYGIDPATGNRTSAVITDASGNKLSEELYTYSPVHSAFMTERRVRVFENLSGQAWERDLVTQYIPTAEGRIRSEIVDPGGLALTTTYSYDAAGNKTSVTDPRLNTIHFEYDLLNRLTTTTFSTTGTRSGSRAATKEIWHDFNGNKAVAIDEEGHYTIYHYDALNRLITTIRDMDGLGLPTRNAAGLVPEATKGSATGNDLVTRSEYDEVGNAIRTIDARGIYTRTFFDSIRRPQHVFSGLTAAEAAGNLAACTAAAATSTEKTHTEFFYDPTKNPGATAFDSSGFKPTQIIRHAAVLTATGMIDLHTNAVYDKVYRPLSVATEYESGLDATTSNSYGAIVAGREARESTVTDARGKITRTIMDGLMRPIQVTDAYNTALASTTQSFFSSTGLAWKSIDPLGRESETDYDSAARPITVWLPDAITGLVNRSTPNSPTLGSPRTQTEYDANSNITATINPLGQRWEYQFDARNRKTLERQPSVIETEIIAGTPQQSSSPLTPLIATTYDGVGTPISTTDARGHTTLSFHDSAYRPTITRTNPVTGNPSSVADSPGLNDIQTQMFYDPNRNVIALTDSNGNTTQNSYDLLNRLTQTATNPSDGQPNAPPATPKDTDILVTNQYDDTGNLTQVTDGEGRSTGFRYDGLNRKTRTLWDEGSAVEKVETITYDALVQLTRTDAKNQLTTYQYDALHRLEDTLYTGATTDNRHYLYDLVGNLREVSYPNETATRKTLRRSASTYDHLNRLTDETSAGVTHTHAYDKAGNRLTTEYGATSRALVNTYDKLNRLLTLTENGTATTSYYYDLTGRVTHKTLPNNSSSLCNFDALGRRLTETTKTSTGGIISAFDYSQAQGTYPSGYDNVGNVLKITETYGHASVNNRSVTNTYDKTYRLGTETIAETAGSTTVTTYAYDRNNNRTQKSESVNGAAATVSTYTVGTFAGGYNSNQVASVTKGSEITNLSYDFNGNLTHKFVNGIISQNYVWDRENCLTQVNDATKGSFNYTYDHRTRRVGRNESAAGGTSDKISFAGGLSVQEYITGNAQPNMEYIRGSDYGGGIGGVLYTIRASARSYNAYNSRGDVVSKTDEANTITWQAAYQAFGTRTQEQGTTLDRQKANTKDEDTWGALNDGHRYRLLGLDIFMSRDPLGFVDGPNDYTYVRQNPWTSFDPLGLASADEKKWQGIAADENRNFAGRIGSSLMAAAEALNPFRSDSSLRDGGRQLQTGLAEGREKMKQAPPGIRELGQLTMGVASAGTFMLSGPAGVGEMVDSIQQQGVVKTGKQMACGLVTHAMNNPVEFGGELLVGGALVKGLKPAGKSARFITYQTQVETNQIMVKAMNGKGADVGALAATYAAESQSLHIDFVGVAMKGQGIGTQLYKQALSAAGDVNQVVGTAALDNAAAISQGGIIKAPRTKILQKLGFSEHTYDAATATMKSKKP